MDQGADDIKKRATVAFNNLSQQYENLTKSKQEIQAQIESTNADLEKLAIKIHKYALRSKQNEMQGKENEKNINQIKELENQINIDEHQLCELSSCIESSVAKLCQERKRRSQIVKKKKESKSDLIKITSAVQTLKDQPSTDQVYHELSNKYKDLTEKINYKQEKLNSQIEQKKKELDQAIDDDKSRKMQFQEIQNEIKEIEGRLQRRDETISLYEHDIQDLNEKHDIVQSEISKLDVAKLGLTESIENSNQIIQKIQQKAVNIALKLKKESAKISKFTKTLISFNSECNDRIHKEESIIKIKEEEEIKKIQVIIGSKQNEIDDLHSKISEVDSETSSILKKIDDIERERKEEQIQLNQMNERAKILVGAMQKFINIDSPLLGRVE